ncbi:hypothetical protein [Spirochaeta dissipatitropha]
MKIRRQAEESRGTEELRFHYRREERDRHRSAGEVLDYDARRRRLSRRLLIIIFDIILVSIVYLIYVFFLQPDPSKEFLNGVSYTATASYFDDSILLRVLAERQEAGSGSGLLSLVVFDADSSQELGRELDTLGNDPDDSRRIHMQIYDYPENINTLRIEISLEDQFGTNLLLLANIEAY